MEVFWYAPTWLSAVLAVMAATLITVLAYVRYMSAYHGLFKNMGIDGPQPRPVIGTIGPVREKGLFQFHKELYDKYKHKKVYGTYDARTPVMVVADLDMIKDICLKKFSSFVNRRKFLELGPPLNRNMGNLKDEHWRYVRATVSPAFTSGKLKQTSALVEEAASNLVQNLREKSSTGNDIEIELWEEISGFVMDVVASTGFGFKIKSHSFGEARNPFVEHFQALVKQRGLALFVAYFFPFLMPYLKTVGLHVFPRKSVEFFGNFVDQAIAERRQCQGSGSKRGDFLQLAVDIEGDACEAQDGCCRDDSAMSAAGKGLSRLDIQGSAMNFILAGNETVTTVLSFTLYLLAMNPDCCRKVQKEIDSILEDGESPTYDKVHKMQYLDKCINESMRLFPPVFFADRECNDDTEIQGIHLPKGMIVNIPIYSIHHDGDIWPEPEDFRPERFSADNKAARHPYAHLPFGAGPRMCIGMRLALLELKIALAAILKDLTPLMCGKSITHVKLQKVRMKAEDGLWVKMVARR